MTLPTHPTADDEFEAAWSRIMLMVQDVQQFNTLFLFNGNDIRKQALLKRLGQTLENQGRTALILPPEGRWALPNCAAPTETASEATNDAAHEATILQLAEQVVLALLKACMGEGQTHSTALSLLVLNLDHSFARHLRQALEAQGWGATVATSAADAATPRIRMGLLARLNERRELLARRVPLLLILPKDYTKLAAQYAPDLWALRLTSQYLQGKVAPLPSEEVNLRPPQHNAQITDGTLTPVHQRVLEHWLQALQSGNTSRLVVSDGWVATQASLLQGQLTQALQLARCTLALAYEKEDLRDQQVSQGWLGDVFTKLGRREDALDAYQVAQQLAEKLATSDPKNSDWQRDLSVSFEKVADILAAQGEREQALQQYQKSLVISEKLAASDPQNSDWQRDLSVSFNKVANILAAQGQREQALQQYQKGLAISEKLAASDPKNSDWQRDLSVSFEKVANILAAQGEREQALQQYQKSLAIREKLAASDPQNSNWQRDLSVSFNKVADILAAQGEREQALQQYQKSLAIRETLAASDPNNVNWQTDLVVSYVRLADFEQSSSKRNAWYDQALAVLTTLDAKDALSAEQKTWIPFITNEKAKWASMAHRDSHL